MNPVDIISWVIFGALAGWVASIIAGRERRGCFMNIVIGVFGAFLGGFLMGFLTGVNPIATSGATVWSWPNFGVAVLGSFLLLWITGAARRR